MTSIGLQKLKIKTKRNVIVKNLNDSTLVLVKRILILYCLFDYLVLTNTQSPTLAVMVCTVSFLKRSDKMSLAQVEKQCSLAKQTCFILVNKLIYQTFFESHTKFDKIWNINVTPNNANNGKYLWDNINYQPKLIFLCTY